MTTRVAIAAIATIVATPGNSIPDALGSPPLNAPQSPPSVTIVSTIQAGSDCSVSPLPDCPVASDNNIHWDGLRHDSRDPLYRTPSGAVPAGTAVLVRFRTFHDDVTAVKMRVWDVNADAQSFVPMAPVATDVSCYQPGLESDTCDFWQATLTRADPDLVWYRFIVTDGTAVSYYADDTTALDGGLGAPSDDVIDNSYAITFYDPAFTTPDWARSAVIYQIFPDRFRNGSSANDPKTGDIRYDDPVLDLPWGTPPEGYCRGYANADTACPWRFDTTPPDWSPTIEGPRGRDYMGGDLAGVDQKLGYLASLGVTAIYLNPIFDSASDHGYDTQDYTRIDPYFGTQQDWDKLVKDAGARGMRVIVDGVFNHMSSDSPLFDRYHHYATVGACESPSSPYRDWFYFQDVAPGSGVCVGSDGGANGATYEGWSDFDTLPVLNKDNPQVRDAFINGSSSIASSWLAQGAGGWRLDVPADPSFPRAAVPYWSTFRQTVKSTDPNALIVGELWPKDTATLYMLDGTEMDTAMNYRLRDAVLGLLAPQPFDSKGFGDSGRQLSVAEAAARLQSIWEDYAPAAGAVLMNLLDSHDTARLLWQLTPGDETQAAKEQNAANLAEGKSRLELASLLQFGLPGAPTIYYGDEVGMTGGDDPDDRRTYPWSDQGGAPDSSLYSHYQLLGQLRHQVPALTSGDFRVLVASDDSGTLAYGRKTASNAAIVAINRSASSEMLDIPVGGYIPDGTAFTWRYGGTGPVSVSGGELHITLGPLAGALLDAGTVDLEAPAAPAQLATVESSDGKASLSWTSSAGATGYNVYRSPVSGGGYVKVNGAPIGATGFTDSDVQVAHLYNYMITALDGAGNESGWSNEVTVVPHFTIGSANVEMPSTLIQTISATNPSASVYGTVSIDGETNKPGLLPGLTAQAGFGPHGSSPIGNPGWTWVDATFNADVGDSDEFVASFLPDAVGTMDYVYRYSTTNGRDWSYADLSGLVSGSPADPGVMTVKASHDRRPPRTPVALRIAASSTTSITLAWKPVAGDATIYGYEVGRSTTAGGPYETLGLVTGTTYSDSGVDEGDTYEYVVRAVDDSYNRSANSAPASATAALRTVRVTFRVTVPLTTRATHRSVYLAGTLDQLDGGLPQWDPGGVVMKRVDSTHWTISLTGTESTQIEYKYTLGDWDHGEKGSSCDEIDNRTLTLSYGDNGIEAINDTVANWRNIAPCGD